MAEWCDASTVLRIAFLTVVTWLGISPSPLAAQDHPVTYGYRIVNTYPHDSQAYTQGLIYRDGFLYESTGLNGHSELRKVQLETGRVIQRTSVDPIYFAEGLTDWGGLLVQLTWKSNIGFLYDFASFKQQGTFRYSGEGWGLTHDQKRLIVSDGSEYLRFFEPQTHEQIGRVAVVDRGKPVLNLNELEYVRNEVYANVWHTDRIAMISPDSGQITGWIDLQGLLPSIYQLQPEAVLNGIAYDSTHNRLFVTGKLWPRLFEIQLERHR